MTINLTTEPSIHTLIERLANEGAVGQTFVVEIGPGASLQLRSLKLVERK